MATPPSPPPPPGKGRPRGSGSFGWRAFFQQSVTPVFVLGKGKRLRYANPAWEKLTGVKLADALGLVCTTKRTATPLQAALAPTPEALAGRAACARRPAPPHRSGPPWWDVTFAPLHGDDGAPFGIVGFLTIVGEPVPAAARKVPASVAALRADHAKHFGAELLAGGSLAAARLVAQVRLAGELAAPVWVVGEPGSGKETVARVIHTLSAQRDRAFVALDCAGLQPYLIESLLFGHGGLGESDRVGTVYLKEPAALPRDLQQRLADHYGEKGARLVCGSNRTAQEAVAAGALVPVYQTALSAFEVRVPPLRDRIDDLPWLAVRIAPDRPLDPSALAVLRAHSWPGNVRELADVLTGAAGTGPLLRDHLPLDMRLKSDTPRTQPKALELRAVLEAVEKRLIQLAMRRTNNHQAQAADLLGLYRSTLANKLEALGLAPKKDGG